jgi:acyl carrier protein
LAQLLHSETICHLTRPAKSTTSLPKESVRPIHDEDIGKHMRFGAGAALGDMEKIETSQQSSLEGIFAEIALMMDRFRKGDAAITMDTDIAQDLNMDSLAVMDLMMELEDKFDVSIPLNMVPEIVTVGQLAQTVLDSKKVA